LIGEEQIAFPNAARDHRAFNQTVPRLPSAPSGVRLR